MVETLDRPRTGAAEEDPLRVASVFRCAQPWCEDAGFQQRAWQHPPPELTPLYPTLLHMLASAAKAPETLGITLLPDDEDDKEDFLSYRALYQRAVALAGVLTAQGISRGDRVLVVLPTSLEFVITFFAVQAAGAIPVPSYPPAALEKVETSLDKLSHVARHSRAVACVTNRLLQPLLGELALRAKLMRSLWPVESLLEQVPAHPPDVRCRPEDPAFIQYTSGSTGNPKGVLLSQRNLVHNVHAAGLAAKINQYDKMVSWLPLYHDMGLIGGLLWPLYWKIPLVLMSPLVFLTRPPRWLWAIHRFRGTVSMGPNFAFALCNKRVRAAEREGLDLSSWRIALNGAEPVNQGTLDEFSSTFGPLGFRPGVHYPCYGLAESSVAVTFSEPLEPLHVEHVDRDALTQGHVLPATGPAAVPLVCVGRAVPGHDVAVVDAEDRPRGPRQVGQVLVRGPSVMEGYYRDPAATALALQRGWLRTGDLGFLTEHGLYITGRAKDLIIVRGKNHYAEDVELMAEQVPGVRPGATVAFGLYDQALATDRVVLVCETKLTGPAERAATEAALREAVLAGCNLKVDQVVLVPPGTVPKTSSGKRQRARCRDLFLAERLAPTRTGKLDLARVLVRSAAGFWTLLRKRSRRRRR